MCVNMCSQKRIIGNQPFVAFLLSWGRGRLISRSCVIKFIEIQTIVTVTNLSETKLTTQNIRKKYEKAWVNKLEKDLSRWYLKTCWTTG